MEGRRGGSGRPTAVGGLSVGEHDRARQRVDDGGQRIKSRIVVSSRFALLCRRSQQSRLVVDWPSVRSRTERTRDDGATSPTACNDDPEPCHFFTSFSLCCICTRSCCQAAGRARFSKRSRIERN